jgi:nucleoside-diphosphate-sugar epimerase
MKVLVTGATGFLGRYVVRELADRGHDVTAFVRSATSARESLTDLRVQLLEGDLRCLDDPLAVRIGRQDAIVHLAAATSGTARVRFDSTVLATERLLEALARVRWGGRLVHVSTLAVYGFNQLPRRAHVDEDTPLEPELGRRDDYAWTKAWQERVVERFAAEHDADVVLVRPGSIYGPERPFQHRLGRLVGDRILVLVGGFTPMPLTYVENAASLLATCVEHPRAAGQVFNAIDPHPPRQWRYLRCLRRAQRRLIIVPLPLSLYRAIGAAYERVETATSGWISPPGFFARYVTTPSFGSFRYQSDKCSRVLAWTPPVMQREALARTFRDAALGGSSPVRSKKG